MMHGRRAPRATPRRGTTPNPGPTGTPIAGAARVLCSALSIVVIDNTILAVAIPDHRARVCTPTRPACSGSAAAYGLVLAGLLLPLAVIGDRRGRKGAHADRPRDLRRRSSVAAAFVPTTARARRSPAGVMGVGGACTMPSTLSILGNIFPEHERGRAIAVWSGVAGVASAPSARSSAASCWRTSGGARCSSSTCPMAVRSLIADGAGWVPTLARSRVTAVDRGARCAGGARSRRRSSPSSRARSGAGGRRVVIGSAIVARGSCSSRSSAGGARRRSRSSRPSTAPRPALRWGAATVSALFFGADGRAVRAHAVAPGSAGARPRWCRALLRAHRGGVGAVRVAEPALVRRLGPRRDGRGRRGLLTIGGGRRSRGSGRGRERVGRRRRGRRRSSAPGSVAVGVGRRADHVVGAVPSGPVPPSGVNETLVEASGALGDRGARQRAGRRRAATRGRCRVRRRGRRLRHRGVVGGRSGQSEPGVDRRRADCLELRGRTRAVDRRRGRSGERDVVERRSPSRASSYSSSRPGPNSSGSSALRLHRTPASSSWGSGCSSSDGTTESSTFEVGHTSRQTPLSARRSRQSGSLDRAHAVLDAVGAEQRRARLHRRSGARRARRRGACESRPASRAMSKASTKRPGGPSSSSLARPNDDDAPCRRGARRCGPGRRRRPGRRCGRPAIIQPDAHAVRSAADAAGVEDHLDELLAAPSRSRWWGR